MKRTLGVAFALILLLSAVSCGTREYVPDGTYSCIAGDTGEQYIFDGKNVRVILYIMGNTAVDYSGTYRLEGDRITLNFPKDTDDIYNGTYYYEIAEDGSSIVIDDDTLTKE